jgi:predicted transcriptional regulator
MITEKQAQKVKELFKQGIPQTEIAKQTGISRTKVAEIIKGSKNSDIENKEFLQDKEVEADPEILNLKKELKKEELRKKIREQKQPFENEKKLKEVEERIDILEDQSYMYFEDIDKLERKIEKLKEMLGVE